MRVGQSRPGSPFGRSGPQVAMSCLLARPGVEPGGFPAGSHSSVTLRQAGLDLLDDVEDVGEDGWVGRRRV